MNPTTLIDSGFSLLEGFRTPERLLAASIEFAALVVALRLLIAAARFRSKRLVALLWTVALAKPVVSLALGSPLTLANLSLPVSAPQVETIPVVTGIRHEAPSSTTTEAPPLVEASRSIVATQTPVVVDRSDRADLPTSPPIPMGPLVVRMVLGVWLLGVAIGTYLSIGARVRLRRVLRSSRLPNAALGARYAALAKRLGFAKAPLLRVSDRCESPALVGLFAPTILFPTWLAEQDDQDKWDWVLRHELMHHKLRDPIANAIRELNHLLFFFHPASWWAGARWEEAAEMACDRAVIVTEREATDYAEQLFQMAERLPEQPMAPLAPSLCAVRSRMGRRITALLSRPLEAPAKLGIATIMTVFVSAAAIFMFGAGIGKEAGKDAQPHQLASHAVNGRDDKTMAVLDSATIEANPKRFVPIDFRWTNQESMIRAPMYELVHFQTAKTIGGFVRNEQGEPITGATVDISEFATEWPFGDYPVPLQQSKTDAEGRWRCDVAPTWLGGVGIQIRHPDYIEARVSATALPIERLRDRQSEIVLKKGSMMTGQVIDAQGAWSANAPSELGTGMFFLDQVNGEPNDAGRFTLTTFEAASARMGVLVDRKIGLIRGVVLAPGGKPAVGADVVLARGIQHIDIPNGRYLSGFNNRLHTKTDAEGRFSFPREAETISVVVVHDGGFAEVAASELEARPDIELTAWRRIEGTLRIGAEKGKAEPVAYSERMDGIRTIRARFAHATRTDREGNFVFDRVPPGRGVVYRRIDDPLHSRSYPSHQQEVEVVSAGVSVATIGGTGRPVTGRFVASVTNGKPIDWTSAYPRSIRSIDRRAGGRPVDYACLIEPDGSFRVEDAPAGKYRLSVDWVDDVDGKAVQWVGARDLTVPPIPDGRSDTPLDLGAIAVERK